MVSSQRFVVIGLLAGALLMGHAVVSPTQSVQAQGQDSWQFHMAQANNFYRNRLLPKALDALKKVVEDPEGAKQLKAWTLMADISTKLKDLDSLFVALEGGLASAKGQEKAQMQAQLYRLKRTYGRILYVAEGGSGKLSDSAVKLKSLDEISDPAAKAYFEKARVAYEKIGVSKGSYYLPAGRYNIDGDEYTIVGGKTISIEVAPTTWVTFGLEAQGVVGGRIGDNATGGAGVLGGLHVGFGPHIQFANGNSLVINVGPLLLFGQQSTVDIAQNIFEADTRPKVVAGGIAQVGLEFRLGTVDFSPRIGYQMTYLPSGMYFSGEATSPVSTGDNPAPSSVLEGDFVVPALAHGPRIGVDVLLTPALVKGKRRPRLFVGFNGGPVWLKPLWGDAAIGSEVSRDGSTTVRNPGASDAADQLNTLDGFTIKQINVGEASMGAAQIYADLQFVLGVQARL
jgi:hypothetical protein